MPKVEAGQVFVIEFKRKEQKMTNIEKYIAMVKCNEEYRTKMPNDVERIELVKTGRDDYPEVIEIHWKSGGKSGIGNHKTVEALKDLIGDTEKFCANAKRILEEDIEKLEPEAEAEAEKTRPWTYVLGVLDEDGNRVERYSWYETNSWDLYGVTDSEVLQQEIESCRRFRAESTSRWHVYKRMRGDTKLQLVF